MAMNDELDFSWLHHEEDSKSKFGDSLSDSRIQRLPTPKIVSPKPVSNNTNSNNNNDNKPSWLTEDTPLITQDPKESKTNSKSNSKAAKVQHASDTTAVGSAENGGEEDGWCCPSDPVLYWCRILHSFAGLTIASALLCNGYLVLLNVLHWRQVVLHCYAMVFCLISLAMEMNIAAVVDNLNMLHYWAARGFFYAFIGFLTFEDIASVIIQDIIGVLTISMGLIYIILGIFGANSLESQHIAAKSLHETKTNNPFLENDSINRNV